MKRFSMSLALIAIAIVAAFSNLAAAETYMPYMVYQDGPKGEHTDWCQDMGIQITSTRLNFLEVGGVKAPIDDICADIQMYLLPKGLTPYLQIGILGLNRMNPALSVQDVQERFTPEFKQACADWFQYLNDKLRQLPWPDLKNRNLRFRFYNELNTCGPSNAEVAYEMVRNLYPIFEANMDKDMTLVISLAGTEDVATNYMREMLALSIEYNEDVPWDGFECHMRSSDYHAGAALFESFRMIYPYVLGAQVILII